MPASRRTPRNEQLNELAAARAELDEKRSELDAEQRASTEAVADAEAELVELERRSLAGEQVDAERAKLERALLDARIQAGQPWGPDVAKRSRRRCAIATAT